MRVSAGVKAPMAPAAKRFIHSLRFQLNTVDREQEVVPGIRVIPAPGHTPGHLAVLIDSDGDRLLHIGDAATHPVHLEHPTLSNGFDQHPEQAAATRRELVDRAASEQMRLMAFHFPFPSVGHVAPRAEGGWDWSPGE